MADFSKHGAGWGMPYTAAVAVTPHDDNDLDAVTRAFMVSATGDATVIMADGGASVTLVDLLPGYVYPLRVSRVLATGTDAISMIALY